MRSSLPGKFVRHVVPGVIKPVHALWNQVIGFLFVMLAVIPIPSIVRNYRDVDKDPNSFGRLVIASLFVLLMAWFGITSFLKARKISRS